MLKDRRLLLLFAFVFVDLLGYSLILPLLPYYAETFGAGAVLVGLLTTSNALAKFIASPFIGRLSDRYGRRPLLIFSLVGTVASFLLMGAARTLGMLFASRVLDGLLGGNISLARAYISDITDEENRAQGMGLIGAAFGMGFIIGPALGGVLSRYGYNVPALFAGGLSFLNLIAVLLWLPESLPKEERERIAHSPRTAITAERLVKALSRPCVGPVLQVRLAYSLAFTLFQSNFALYAKYKLGLEAATTSYVLTYVGLMSVLVQGFAIGRLTARFREKKLVFWATLGLAGALLAWGFVPNVWLLLVVLMPIALSAGVLNTVLTSVLTKSVYQEELGGTLGLSSSLQTLSQILMPGFGGLLISSLGPWSLGVIGSALMILTSYLTKERVLPIADTSPGECQPSTAAA